MTTATAPAPKVPKKKTAKPAATTPAKKKVKKTGTVHIARTPEQVVAEQTGMTFHGATLTTGNTKKAGKEGVLSFLDLKQLQPLADFNPRTNPGPVEELAASIKADGVLSALVVRPSKVSGKFDIIAGERRYKACKAISYDRPIPCIIRPDLIGDDERALAIALAENSEDGRTSLNLIEIGQACKKLEKKGWNVARIARESSLHVQRVRRALALLDTPDEVQKNIANGNWSVAAGLEYARLDEETRKAVKAKLSQATTADDIRKYRKQAEQAASATKAAKGEPVSVTKKGKAAKKSPVTIWRPSRALQALIQEMCAALNSATADEIGTPDYHEIRGGIAVLLWHRGDRENPYAPDASPDKNAKDFAAQMKDLTNFNTIVKAEAAKYVPEKDQDGGDEGEG